MWRSVIIRHRLALVRPQTNWIAIEIQIRVSYFYQHDQGYDDGDYDNTCSSCFCVEISRLCYSISFQQIVLHKNEQSNQSGNSGALLLQ